VESTPDDPKITGLPLPILHGWTDTRDFPPFAAQSFRDWWRRERKNGKDS
jgi:L-lactate dehydrogenase complex protein LldF